MHSKDFPVLIEEHEKYKNLPCVTDVCLISVSHLWLMTVTGREEVPARDIFICDEEQTFFRMEDPSRNGTEGDLEWNIGTSLKHLMLRMS